MTRILLVEDNEMNRDMLSRRLTRKGYELIFAEDGEQAIAVARAEKPDLVLMDLSLPVIDGWEATRRLRADPETAGLRILALTSHAMSGDREKAIRSMIEVTVAQMYRVDDTNRFLEVTYQGGDKEILYFKDFSSGAMIENIVRRAKKLAIKRLLAGDGRGIRLDDMIESTKQEYKDNEDLPNTTNPDDWAKISGKKGERIIFIRTLINREETDVKGGRSIQHVGTGQYL